jgi:hypothetical protein
MTYSRKVIKSAFLMLKCVNYLKQYILLSTVYNWDRFPAYY